MNEGTGTGATLSARHCQNCYYRANAKGTGSAVRFELHPAHDDVSGSLFVEMALQQTIGSRENGKVVFPTFDWKNRIIFKLDKTDLSQILQVFRGMRESVVDGKGLFHQSARGSTVIKFSHQIEPVPGYMLSVSKKLTGGDLQRGYYFFNPDEAFELSVAIESAMLYICFGIPVVIPRAERIPVAGPSPLSSPRPVKPVELAAAVDF